MAGRPYAAGASDDGRRHAGRAGRGPGRPSPGVAEMLRAGHDHRRDQERLRPDRARRGAHARDRPQATEETTFLGAHVVPECRTPAAYVDLVTGPMLDACAPYARWIDVFCEQGPSTPTRPGPSSRPARPRASGPAAREPARARARRAARGRARRGVGRPLHVPRRCRRRSARRLRHGRALLPGVEFSTRPPYPDARRLIDAGVTVALATDCNPGSLHLVDGVLHRAGRAGHADDPGRGAAVATRAARRRCGAMTWGICPGARADLVC